MKINKELHYPVVYDKIAPDFKQTKRTEYISFIYSCNKNRFESSTVMNARRLSVQIYLENH